jgi:hypothetical protein
MIRKNAKILSGLTGKQKPWLRAYLDESNPKTFLNKTAAARAAGYRCKNDNGFICIGQQNYLKLQDHIEKWLDEEGLSENRLKMKLLSLVEAKQHYFQKIKGHVKPEDLPPGVVIMSVSHKMSWAGKGEDAEPFDDGDTVVAIPVEALETQRRTLEMAMKVKGMYAPEQIKVEHTNLDEFSDEERKNLKEIAKKMAKGAAKSKQSKK